MNKRNTLAKVIINELAEDELVNMGPEKEKLINKIIPEDLETIQRLIDTTWNEEMEAMEKEIDEFLTEKGRKVLNPRECNTIKLIAKHKVKIIR